MEWIEDPSYPRRCWDLFVDGNHIAWILDMHTTWSYDIMGMRVPVGTFTGTRQDLMDRIVAQLVAARMNT